MADAFATIRSLGPGQGERPLTEEERDSIEDVLGAAMEWKAGRLPTVVAANIGTVERDGHPSPRYSRFAALLRTPRGDPRRLALIDLCEELDRMQGARHTKHGRFTNYELQESGRHVARLMEAGKVWRGAR